MLQAMFRMRMGHYNYWDSYQSCIRLQAGACIGAVLTADVVASDEVNYSFDWVIVAWLNGFQGSRIIVVTKYDTFYTG